MKKEIVVALNPPFPETALNILNTPLEALPITVGTIPAGSMVSMTGPVGVTVPYSGHTGTTVPLNDLVKEALRKKLAARHGAIVNNAPAKAEPVKPPDPVTLLANQQLFTTLFGVTPAKLKMLELNDFGVSVLDPSIVGPMSGFKQVVDPAYTLQVAEAHAILMGWESHDKCLVVGPTGSGKSSLIKHLCAHTNRPMLRINMTGDIESATLFGQLVVEGGATVWKDGPVTEGVRYGAVVILDEWDVTPPEILFGLQWLFEENGRLFLKEMPGDSTNKFVLPDDNFRLCCLGNTLGQGDDTGRYSGTNVQNNASIDRFQTTVGIHYLDAKHEVAIVTGQCPYIDKATAEKMVSFAALVRVAADLNKINLSMSPRTLVNWGRKRKAFGNDKVALELAFTNKLVASDKHIVNEFYETVFGIKL